MATASITPLSICMGGAIGCGCAAIILSLLALWQPPKKIHMPPKGLVAVQDEITKFNMLIERGVS
jgi:hypothetical protein